MAKTQSKANSKAKAAPKKTATKKPVSGKTTPKKKTPKKSEKDFTIKLNQTNKRKGDHLFKEGNQLWKRRSKHGRDKIFATPAIMWEAACEYFEHCVNNPFEEEDFVRGGEMAGSKVHLNRMRPFTIHGLCLFMHVNTKYFNDFEYRIEEKEDRLSKDFSEVITQIRETIHDQKFSGAAAGFFKENIIARDLGLTDKKDLSVKGVTIDFSE